MERLTEDSALEGRAWIKRCASACPYDGGLIVSEAEEMKENEQI